MEHSDWIKKQFDKRRTIANYRNVLIHTSFIESITRKSANGANFDCAIKILSRDPQYKNGALANIDKLRNNRNKIIHEILENKSFKTENDIKGVVVEMKRLLKVIYSESGFIKGYFEKFGIDMSQKF